MEATRKDKKMSSKHRYYEFVQMDAMDKIREFNRTDNILEAAVLAGMLFEDNDDDCEVENIIDSREIVVAEGFRSAIKNPAEQFRFLTSLIQRAYMELQ